MYSDYHPKLAKLERELASAEQDREVLRSQAGALESRCVGLERDLTTLRRQHTELHAECEAQRHGNQQAMQAMRRTFDDALARLALVEAQQQVHTAQPPQATTFQPVPRTLNVPEPIGLSPPVAAVHSVLTSSGVLSGHAATIGHAIDPPSSLLSVLRSTTVAAPRSAQGIFESTFAPVALTPVGTTKRKGPEEISPQSLEDSLGPHSTPSPARLVRWASDALGGDDGAYFAP